MKPPRPSIWKWYLSHVPVASKGHVHGSYGGLTEQEQLALMRSLDDPRHLESPPGFKWRAALAKFNELVELLEYVFDCTAQTSRHLQDTAAQAIVIIPAEATDSGDFLMITFCNFGQMAVPALGAPGTYGEDEVRILLDPRDQTRIDGALGAMGYTIVSEFVLWVRYDGDSALRSSPGHPPTWWDRYFGDF